MYIHTYIYSYNIQSRLQCKIIMAEIGTSSRMRVPQPTHEWCERRRQFAYTHTHTHMECALHVKIGTINFFFENPAHDVRQRTRSCTSPPTAHTRMQKRTHATLPDNHMEFELDVKTHLRFIHKNNQLQHHVKSIVSSVSLLFLSSLRSESLSYFLPHARRRISVSSVNLCIYVSTDRVWGHDSILETHERRDSKNNENRVLWINI